MSDRGVIPAKQCGMTLLETLVTLVIVSMVAGLLSEGLFQVARIEQRLSGASMQAQLERLHAIWLQQALEGLMPGTRETPDRFRGAARELAGLSTQLPEFQRQGPRSMRLVIRFDADEGLTELQLNFDSPGGVAKEGVVLARWTGDAGAFRYLDSSGIWHDRWPPSRDGAQAASSALPQAIAVDRGQAGGGVLLVAHPAARAEPLARRIDMSKLP